MKSPAHLPTLLDCVHCGLCLPSCPTYHVTGREVQSPRGRIAALRAVEEGRTFLTPALAAGLEDCLVCRACETVCPSGISMEGLMAGHREHARAKPGGTDLRTRAEIQFLRRVVPFPRRVRLMSTLLRAAAPILRPFVIGRDLPSAARLRSPAPFPAAKAMQDGNARRGTVAVFRGCIADRWLRDETLAAARVLERNGWRVTFGESACCGALHKHAGLRADATRLANAASEMLLAGQPKYIVVDSAGCAATLREPAEGAAPAWRAIAPRVVDTLTLLVREGWDPPARKLPGRFVVAPPCHQTHGHLPVAEPRALLGQLFEQGYRELPGHDHCCGAAGLYLMRRPELSRRIGEVALTRFRAANADTVVTGNAGCLLRWESLLRREPGTRAVHPVVAVEEAYLSPSTKEN